MKTKLGNIAIKAAVAVVLSIVLAKLNVTHFYGAWQHISFFAVLYTAMDVLYIVNWAVVKVNKKLEDKPLKVEMPEIKKMAAFKAKNSASPVTAESTIFDVKEKAEAMEDMED